MKSASSPWSNRSPGDLSIVLPEVWASDPWAAIAAAATAAPRWAGTPLPARIERLRDVQQSLAAISEELAAGIALETGKPLTEARGELSAVIGKFDLSIADAEKHLTPRTVTDGPHPAIVRRLARGPAVVIAPFNFPLHLGHGALLPHLLAGNPVIFKPSPLAAVVAGCYAEVFAAALPDGVFSLVQGGAEEAQALCRDPRVRAVCFTGSVPAGRALSRELAADFSKELALELGGRNAAIVCADADLELAANGVADALCLTCGQRCNATTRILVDARVAASFNNHLGVALQKYQPGDPRRAETKLGPLISAAALERYDRLLHSWHEWIAPGGVCGEVDGFRGHYVLPAIRHGVAHESEECFVPIADHVTFANLDQAVRLHNATPFGLTASIFTRSELLFRQLGEHLEVGNLYANLPTTFSPSTLPFGGLRDSGNGRPAGRGFIRFATQEQAVQWTGLA